MSTRELRHPVVEVEDHAEGFLIRVYAPGSKLGAVEIVLSPDEADDLSGSLDQARVFSEAARQ